MEAGEPDAMKLPPRNAAESVFAGGTGVDIAYQGLLVAVLTLAAYLLGHYWETGIWAFTDSAHGMTMAFLTMSMAELFQSFNMRSRRGSVFALRQRNRWLWGGAAVAFVLTAAVLTVPALSDAFGFAAVSLREYAAAAGLAVLIIPAVELVKWVQRKLNRGHFC